MTQPTEVPGVEGSLGAALGEPAGEGPWPGVVVLHELLGLNDDIRAHTDRIAAAGYLAVAPDLFSWGPKARCLVSTIRQLRFGHQGRTLQDVRAIARWLGRGDDCTGRVGTLGFCMGGGLAILLAPSPEFAASAPNYGPVPDDAETALAGACPIVASFGGRDRMLRGHARRLEAALTTLGVAHDVREYPEAGHSFLSRHGPALRALGAALAVGFRESEAEDAWCRIVAFFDSHLRDDDAPASPG